MKTYRSNSIVHIGIVKPDGSRVRVSFDALTGGGSLYSTSDKNIQFGLERHAGFNKIFRLVDDVADEPLQETPAHTDEEEAKTIVVNVSDLDDAKEYLVEKFGLSRTKLRSKAQILAAASDNGIEFTGI